MAAPRSKTPKIRLRFSPAEAVMLRKSGFANFTGGFQGVVKMVDDRLEGRVTLELTDEEFGRMFRTATQYGSGGYQDMLRSAISNPLLRALYGSRPRKKANVEAR